MNHSTQFWFYQTKNWVDFFIFFVLILLIFSTFLGEVWEILQKFIKIIILYQKRMGLSNVIQTDTRKLNGIPIALESFP